MIFPSGWEGTQYTRKTKITIKEEIMKLSESEFKAVYYRKVKNRWDEFERELLKRKG